MENENRKIFNKLAADYENLWVKDKKEKKRIEKIVNKFKIKDKMTVLEAGCGKGEFTPFILKKIGRKGFVYLVDISDKMLKYASRNLKKFKNKKILNSCASKIPVEDKFFDMVIVFNSFPHFFPKENFIKEFYRILKNKGGLIIAHDLPKAKINRIHQEVNFNMRKNLLPEKKKMLKMLNKYGFVVKKYLNKEYYLLKAVKM